MEESLLTSEKDTKDKGVRLCLSYRLLVTLLCMTALITCFAAQSSMGSTMVCMLEDAPDGSYSNSNDTDSAVVMDTNFVTVRVERPHEQRYSWSKKDQGWIHSSFFIGYYVTLLPSGILATRYGGRRVAVLGLLVSALTQMLTPVSASVGVVFLCAVRFCCGFANGFVYAPTFAVLANWVPAAESSLLFGLAGTGIELGAAVSFCLSATVCESDVIGGWPLVYYIMGLLSILSSAGFFFLVSDLPSQNRWMRLEERDFIESAIYEAGGHGHKDANDNSPLTSKIPVSAILRSPAVWAIVVAQLGSDWLYYLLITVMPDYMAEVMQLSNTTTTLLTGLPFLTIIPSIYLVGSLADYLRRKEIMSTTAVRKSADFICKIFPGAILIIISYLGPGQAVTMAVLYVLGLMLLSFIYVSWITNPVDLSPAYTGFITSLCECGSMWIAIVVPIIVEFITKDEKVSQWRLVFYITGGLQVVTFLFYLAFGSSVLQPWGRPDGAGDDSSSEESDFQYFRVGSSYVKRKRLRMSLPCPYASDGEIGRLRAYREQRYVISDTEDDCYIGPTVDSKLSDSRYAPKGATAYSGASHAVETESPVQERHKLLTSDTEARDVTGYGSVSAHRTGARDESGYETVELNTVPASLTNGNISGVKAKAQNGSAVNGHVTNKAR